MVHTTLGWFRPKFLVRTRKKWYSPATRFAACELIKAGATRFDTHTLVGERLLKLKAALQRTVVDPDYLAAKYKDTTDTE